MNNWWRLINQNGELLGQLLLPWQAFHNNKSVYQFALSGRLPANPFEQPIPAHFEIVTLHHVRDNACTMVGGTLLQLEQAKNVRFFPSYGLTSGVVAP